MAEYIDRGALIEWLKRIRLIDLSDGRGLCRVIMEDNFKKAIRKMPKSIIVDVAPVRHGRWAMSSDRPDTIICTCCDSAFDVWKADIKRHHYCPNCGARMDGDGE